MNKKLLMIVGPVLLLVIGGVVAFMFLMPKPAKPNVKKLKETAGPTYLLRDPFTMNLADTSSPHYVKTTIELEASKYSAKLVPPDAGDKTLPIEGLGKIRDMIISELGKRTYAQLSTEKGRQDLKDAIKADINAAGEKDKGVIVTDVYFTDFAVQ